MSTTAAENNLVVRDYDNMWDGGFDVDDFLIPWRRVLEKWEEGVGVVALDSELEIKLRNAARSVYDAVFEHPKDQPEDDTIENAEWLLKMLAPGGGEDPEALALIPDSFWSKLAGRAIVLVMKTGRKDVFLPMKEASIQLGVDETRLYHLALTRRIPSYIDTQERNYRLRRRFRVDQLKEKYPIIYKSNNGEKEVE